MADASWEDELRIVRQLKPARDYFNGKRRAAEQLMYPSDYIPDDDDELECLADLVQQVIERRQWQQIDENTPRATPVLLKAVLAEVPNASDEVATFCGPEIVTVGECIGGVWWSHALPGGKPVELVPLLWMSLPSGEVGL